MFLSLKNPTFRGRREVYLAQNKQENFLEISKLIAKYNPVTNKRISGTQLSEKGIKTHFFLRMSKVT